MRALSRSLAFLPFLLLSSHAGTIQGRVYEARSGLGLPGASVLIEGTTTGASADVDGSFFILRVQPGTYMLQASMIGYKTQTRRVDLTGDETADVDFYLQEEVISLGEEVVVTAERPLIEPEMTSSVRALSSSDMADMNVENVTSVLKTQAGVSGEDTDIHIRGGRSNEILMLVDGIPVRDPLSGSAFGIHVPTTAIRELEALTGGFNAEYGEAMSGVINVDVKEGRDRIHGNLNVETDHLGPLDYFNTRRLEGSLEGPLPFKMTFFANLYYNTSDTYLSKDKFISDAYQAYVGPLYSSVIGTDALSPGAENTISGIAKITWKASNSRKISLSLSRSLEINHGYFFSRSDYPFAYGFPWSDGDIYYLLNGTYPVFTRDGNQSTLSLHQLLGEKAYFDLRLSRFFTNLHIDVNGKRWDEYNRHTDYYIWHDHYVEQYITKFDYTRMLTAVHSIKTGFLMELSEIQWIDIQYPWFYHPDGLGYNHDLYRAYTTKGGGYVQTQTHFAGMIANLGLRVDFWIPGLYLERSVKEALKTQDLHNVVRREYERYLESSYEVPFLDGYRMKAQVSPRIGIAYPISESDKFFLSFGHFSQMPDFKYVFSKLGVRASSTYELEGNPNLKPITTVMYELGVEHLFGPEFKLSVTAYYKDVFNYPTASLVPAESPNEPDFWMYFNSDYSRSFGLEFVVNKRLTGHIYGDLEVTLAQAMGKASSEEDQYWRGEVETLREWHLRWDRPWKIYGRLGVRYRTGDHPVLFGITLPDNWRFNVELSLQSGQRYTPEDSLGIQGEQYSGIGPYWQTVEFTFKKGIDLGPLDAWLTLEGRNILNHTNAYYINDLTGRAYEPGDPYVGMPDESIEFDLMNPARYREPRSFLIGLEVSW